MVCKTYHMYLSWLLYDIPCTPKVWHLQGEYYMYVIIKECICIRMVGRIFGCFSIAVDFAVFLCEILSLSYRISPPVKWACKVLWALRVFTRCKKKTSTQRGESLFALFSGFSFVKKPTTTPLLFGKSLCMHNLCINFMLENGNSVGNSTEKYSITRSTLCNPNPRV